MSTTVDRRVVDMEFNNQRFERNVATTMSSLDKLKEKLSFKGAAKGLDDINTSAKRINLSGLTNAAETVGVKFNAMWTIADQVFRNITNSAYYTGKRMISALTVDPIKAGLSEYETQINSVQTILANTESKGTTLGQVNAALDELNTYADKTIYNFTEMTRNIGTFTAAGVDLKTSVNAIQGIANLAAVSGSTSQQASTAMYQLSQALSSGTVKLMDWNSVVNAGMGGQVFQDALKETARVHGIKIDEMIEKHGSFRETLQEGWITSDILTETLSHFTMAAEEGSAQWEAYKKSLMDTGYSEEQANAILKLSNTATDAATKVKTATQLWDTLKETAQSGWTQTWELIMGDFGEAKDLFSGIYNALSPILEASAKARNELLSGGLSSGWKQLMGAGIADEEGYKDIFQTLVKEEGVAFDQMIKKEGSFEAALKKGLQNGLELQRRTDGLEIDQLTNNAVLKDPSWRDNLGLDPKLKSTAITSDMLSGSVMRLADKMRNMSLEEREAAGYTAEHVEQIEALAAGLKDGSISMDEFRDKILKPSGRENIIEGLKNACAGLAGIIRPIKEAFRTIFPRTTAEQLYSFTESFRNLTERFKLFSETHGDKIRSTFEGIFAVIDIGWTFVKELIGGIGALFGKLKGAGSGFLSLTASLGEWLTGLRDTVKETDIFGVAIDKVVGFLGKIIDKIKQFWSAIKGAFELPGVQGFYNVMRGIWDIILKIGSKVGHIFAPIGEAVGNLFKSGNVTDLVKDGLLAGLIVAVTRTVSSLKSLFDDVSGEGGLFGGIKDALDSVKGCFEAYQNTLNAEALKKIAIAIAILAASIFVIASIDSDALDRSLAAIGIMFAELIGSFALFTKLNKNQKGLIKASTAIITLASAALILSLAMKIMSKMSWDEIGRGLVGTAGGIGILVGAVHLLPEKKVNKGAKAIRTLAIATVILAAGMKIMASMSWEELGRGIAGTVGGLGALVGAVNLLPKDTGLRTLGMIGLTTSLVILAGALKIMATMSWKEIGKSLSAMGGALLEMVLALKLMPKDTVIKSVGIFAIAGAMVVLAGAMKILATMSWEELGKGLAAMGGSLLLLAVALKFMKGSLGGAAALVTATMALALLAPVLKILGSMSWEEIGKSLIMLAGALAVLGVAGLLLKPLIPAILGLSASMALFGVGLFAAGAGVVLLSAGISALGVALPLAATGIVAGIAAIIMGIIDLIPSILSGFGDWILGFCAVIAECAPAIVETLGILISEICTKLATYVPVIVDAIFDLFIGILHVLTERMPEFISAVVDLLVSFFSNISKAVKGIDVGTLVEAAEGFGFFAALAAVLSWIGTLIPGAMTGALGIGALIAEIALIIAAIGALGQIPGLKWLVDEGGEFLEAVGNAIGKFVGGLIGGFGLALSESLPEIGTNLSEFMVNATPFIDGCKKIDDDLVVGVTALSAAIVLLTAADLINSITTFLTGAGSMARMGTDLATFMTNAEPFVAAAKEIKPEMLAGVRTLADTILILTAANVLDGLTSWLTGGSSLAKFSDELPKVGTGLGGLVSNIGTFGDSEATTVSYAAEAIKSLAEAADEIPNEGGMWGLIAGDSNLKEFAEYFPDAGKGIKGFITNVGTFGESQLTTITHAAGAIKVLAEAAKEIPNEGGMWGLIAGDSNLRDFASYFPDAGTGIKDFITNVGTFGESQLTTMTHAAGAIKVLAEAAKEIPNEGGMWGLLAGDSDLGEFAGKFGDIGSGIKAFITNIGIFGSEELATMTSGAGAIKTLAEAAKKLPETGGLWSYFVGDNQDLETFATQFPKIGTSFRAFVNNIGEFTTAERSSVLITLELMKQIVAMSQGDVYVSSSIEGFVDALSAVGTAINDFDDAVYGYVSADTLGYCIESVNSILDMLDRVAAVKSGVTTNFAGALSEIADLGVSEYVGGLTDEEAKTEAMTAGKTLMSNVALGIEEGQRALVESSSTAMGAWIHSMIMTMQTATIAASTVGKNFVIGFANGISVNTFIAVARARFMAQLAVSAAKLALGIQSPSKVGYSIGDFFGIGFANGIADSAKNAYSASSDMAESAKTGLQTAFDKIERIISGEVEISPTIRPVLDLTNVKSGANSINDMFSLRPSVDVLSHVGAVNTLMNQRSQNGGSDEIVSAIKGLRKDIGNMKTTTNYFGGISYSHGDEIDDAISTLVRYLKIEGRV